MKTAKEWMGEVDTHMPDESDRFERRIRAIQADALEAAAKACEADEKAAEEHNRNCHPQMDCDIIWHSSGKACAHRVRKLKEEG